MTEIFDQDDTEQSYEYVRPSLGSPWSAWRANFRARWNKRFASKLFEQERMEAWLGYYAQLYQTQAPNEVLFRALLDRYGMWEFRNPFCAGNEAFYNYHEDILFLADVNFVLDVWIKKNLRPDPAVSLNASLSNRELPQNFSQAVPSSVLPPDSTPTPSSESTARPEEQLEIEKKFHQLQQGWHGLFLHAPHHNVLLSIGETERANALVWEERHEYWYDTALNCLEMVFLKPPSHWSWMKKHLHMDNLKLLCRAVSQHSAKPEMLFSSWLEAGWLQEHDRKWFLPSVSSSDRS